MNSNLDNITTWQVLLVDDEPDNLEVVADTLEFYGMTVRTAGNGQICLNMLKDWLPDLILLDLSMPVMDGWATLRQLKSDEHTKSLPVLALSAHAIIGDSRRALDAGFDGYMTKPVNVPSLIQDLRAALKDSMTRQSAKMQSTVEAAAVTVNGTTTAEAVTTPTAVATTVKPAVEAAAPTAAEKVTVQAAEPLMVQSANVKEETV